jgi:hypothetical protein
MSSHHAASAGAPVNAAVPIGSKFQYVGATAVTIVGPMTGARYRFERPGSELQVDPRDCPALSRLPVLKPVG